MLRPVQEPTPPANGAKAGHLEAVYCFTRRQIKSPAYASLLEGGYNVHAER